MRFPAFSLARRKQAISSSAIKRDEKIFAALRKNLPTKDVLNLNCLGRNRCFSGRVVDPGVFSKTIILLGLAGYELIITQLGAQTSYLSLHIQRALLE